MAKVSITVTWLIKQYSNNATYKRITVKIEYIIACKQQPPLTLATLARREQTSAIILTIIKK